MLEKETNTNWFQVLIMFIYQKWWTSMLGRRKNLTDGEEKEGQSFLQRAHLLCQWSSLRMNWTECVGQVYIPFCFPTVLHRNALCCYPNGNGSVRNLSLNNSTAPIFLLFNYFWEFFFCYNLAAVSLSFIFEVQDDRIHKAACFLHFPFRLPKFWGRVEQIFPNSPRKYLSSWRLKAFSQWIRILL